MRRAAFLALDREKIGTKLYGYVLEKRYTSHAGDLLWLSQHRQAVSFQFGQTGGGYRIVELIGRGGVAFLV